MDNEILRIMWAYGGEEQGEFWMMIKIWLIEDGT